MARKLKGKVAIVTGASSGVGWQSAFRLGEQGVKLCVVARRLSALDALCEQIRERGGEAFPVQCDVTDAAQVQHAVTECIEHYGRIDILVNDAGVQSYGYFEQLPWEDIERTFQVNAFGAMRFARAVLPHFRKQGSGHIINVASMLSKGAAPLLSAYTASKHAMFGWSEAIRLELYGTGIDVSAVLVPSVATPMFDHAPTQLSVAPQPVPPTYHPDVAAKAVVKMARSPKAKIVPVFLQGNLLLWVNAVAGPVADWVMGHFGARMQMRNEPVQRPHGNLYEPVPQGVGAMGSVPPTPKLKRWAGGAVVMGALAGVVTAAGFGTAGLVKALR